MNQESHGIVQSRLEVLGAHREDLLRRLGDIEQRMQFSAPGSPQRVHLTREKIELQNQLSALKREIRAVQTDQREAVQLVFFHVAREWMSDELYHPILNEAKRRVAERRDERKRLHAGRSSGTAVSPVNAQFSRG